MTTAPVDLNIVTSPPISEPEFFQGVPPGQKKVVQSKSLTFISPTHVYGSWTPEDLLLHCTTDDCSGMRYFRAADSYSVYQKEPSYLFPTYICRNCGRSVKRFAISATYKDGNLEILKYGENPQFGPPNPSKLISLMGSQREMFLKGRRCENQGLGIAAFAYYRRVVENQKGKIIDEIRKVAEKLGTFPDLVVDLKAAKAETRFTQALELVKHGLPPILLINGHNPLNLLHSALSEGLHATSDEECLALATSIRVVLAELVERIATAVSDSAELNSAVQRLVEAGGKQKKVDTEE